MEIISQLGVGYCLFVNDEYIDLARSYNAFLPQYLLGEHFFTGHLGANFPRALVRRLPKFCLMFVGHGNKNNTLSIVTKSEHIPTGNTHYITRINCDVQFVTRVYFNLFIP